MLCPIKSLLPAEHGLFLIVRQLQEAQVEPTDCSDASGYWFGHFALVCRWIRVRYGEGGQLHKQQQATRARHEDPVFMKFD